MSVSGSFDDRLAVWLRDGPDAAPSDLLEEIIDNVGTVPRRRALPNGMSLRSWPILAAAALLIAVVGLAVLPRTSLPPGPGASPSVGVSPTPSPSGSAISASLPAGSYFLSAAGDAAAPRLGVTVPTGWRSECDSLPCFALVSGTSGESVGIGYWVVAAVFEDPCHPFGSQALGPSVDDLATALANVSGTTATRPVAARLGGHPGRSLDLVIDAGIACEPASFHLWSAPGNSRRYAQARGQTLRLWIVEVDGQRVLVQADWVPGASEATVAELLRVAASATFDP